MKNDFLKGVFGDDGRVNRSKGDAAKTTVVNDKWDRSDFNAIYSELREFRDAEQQLQDFTPTGGRAIEDTFYSVMKAGPEQKDGKEIKVDHLINRFVMGEAMEMSEWDELRSMSVGDIVSSGLACKEMEPELEIIFDRLKDHQQQLQELAAMMEQMAGLEDQSDSLEDLINNGDSEGEGDNDAQDYQQQQQLIQQQMEQLRQEIEGAASELSEQLDDARLDVRQALQSGLEKGIEEAELMDDTGTMWGTQKGALQKLPAEKRIALARKLDTNEKFRKVAQLIGPMLRMAFAEQQRKTLESNNEVYDIEKGNDLSRVIPSELVGLTDETVSLDFFARYNDHSLLQYKLRGDERVAKGDIIVLEDGSGSMGGNREVWAKAFSIALLNVARIQHRGFTGVHFSSANEYKKYEFDFKHDRCDTEVYTGEEEKLTIMDGVLDFAELFWGGGTEFTTPLSIAVDKLQQQFDKEGSVKGDIVFITDGECGVDSKWLEKFQETKEALGFRVWGLMIGGGNPESEPFNTICDGRTFKVNDFSSGSDVRKIFGGV